jgi:hypothetical protein
MAVMLKQGFENTQSDCTPAPFVVVAEPAKPAN